MKPRLFIFLAQCTLPQRRSPFALPMANRRLRCTGVWKRPWKRGFTSISPDAEAKAGHAPIHKLPAKAARVIGCAISPGGAKRQAECGSLPHSGCRLFLLDEFLEVSIELSETLINVPAVLLRPLALLGNRGICG